MRTRVHWAKPTDAFTACGKVALEEDGKRRLETDTDIKHQVDCRTCLRLAKKEEV